ncbi:MAG: GNAT family N-acetyltransferase [Luteolibacter sp.]
MTIEANIIRFDVEVEGVQETQFMLHYGNAIKARVGVKHFGVRVAQVRQLYVDPLHRHQGIGTRLIEECCRIAAASGCEAIALTVAQCNAGVEPFYTRQGFTIAVEYADGEIVLVKPIGPAPE